MGIESNFMDILKFTYSWIYSKKSQQLFLLLMAVQFVTDSMYILGVISAMGGLTAALSVPFSPADLETPLFRSLFEIFWPLATFGVISLAIGLALVFFSWLIPAYFTTMAMFHALASKGFSSVQWTPRKYINYILLTILHSIYAYFSLLNRRFWPLVAAFMLLSLALLGTFSYSILSFLNFMKTGTPPSQELLLSKLFELLIPNLVLLGLVFLVGIPYFILVVYNSIRQSMCFPIYLEREMSKTDAIKNSWQLTEGRAFEVFITSIGLGIVWGIGIGLASFVAQILGKIAEAFSTNPSYMALYVLLLLGNTVIAWLIVSFSAFISAHISVGIYHALRTAGPKKTEVRQA